MILKDAVAEILPLKFLPFLPLSNLLDPDYLSLSLFSAALGPGAKPVCGLSTEEWLFKNVF
jgi:hypothetical protein